MLNIYEWMHEKTGWFIAWMGCLAIGLITGQAIVGIKHLWFDWAW